MMTGQEQEPYFSKAVFLLCISLPRAATHKSVSPETKMKPCVHPHYPAPDSRLNQPNTCALSSTECLGGPKNHSLVAALPHLCSVDPSLDISRLEQSVVHTAPHIGRAEGCHGAEAGKIPVSQHPLSSNGPVRHPLLLLEIQSAGVGKDTAQSNRGTFRNWDSARALHALSHS